MLANAKTLEHQRLRMQRIGLGLLGAVFHTLACALFWYGGLFRTSLSTLIVIFTTIWIINLVFPLLVLSGLNRYFKDPSLTLIMVLWSQVVVMFTVYFVEEYRPLMLLFAILGIAFSAYRLETKESLFVAFFSIGLYLTVLFLLHHYYPTLLDPVPEWTVGLSYACIACFTAMVTSELNAARRHLIQKNLELESSLYIMQNDFRKDELTGLKNQRYILEILEEQRNITEREVNYKFTVALLSVDNLQEIYDSYGPAVGDKALLFFTTQTELQLRKNDSLARMSGEEFLLVCPFTDREKCRFLIDRICQRFTQEQKISGLPKLMLKIRVGIAGYQRPEKIESLLIRVGKALYIAKEQKDNPIAEDN